MLSYHHYAAKYVVKLLVLLHLLHHFFQTQLMLHSVESMAIVFTLSAVYHLLAIQKMHVNR